jgi:adenosine deaminase
MTSQKLSVIKQYQRDYHSKFNERLEIDWHTMNNVPKLIPTLDELFKEVVEEHGASEELIMCGKRLHSVELSKEKAAVTDFCKKVVHYQLSFYDAAKKINRDRSLIYYYGIKCKPKH